MCSLFNCFLPILAITFFDKTFLSAAKIPAKNVAIGSQGQLPYPSVMSQAHQTQRLGQMRITDGMRGDGAFPI